MKQTLLIYGAYGFSGELIVRRALEFGLKPVLSGRNETKTHALATELGLESRPCDLEDSSALAQLLDDVQVVLHCAGPFSATCEPMLKACLSTETHYLDITGEISVFEGCAARDDAAKTAGIMVMPGVGFDVVPSDCLAAHIKGSLPGAVELDLAFMALGGGVSRGTARTMAENIHRGGAVRREGKITPIPSGSLSRHIDFGRGETHCMAIPWGDVSTAFYSTGINNIAVYVPVPRSAAFAARTGGWFSGILGSNAVQSFLKKRIDARPPGPSEERRKSGQSLLWGEGKDADGNTFRAKLVTPEGYTLTAMTAVEVAKQVLDGNWKPGFQTPSMVYGADFITSFEGVERQDL